MTESWADDDEAKRLSRIEDASLNASAVPQQRWIDGWLVRYSNGKPKRARCINALAEGRLPFDERLASAASLFADAGLPMVFRITRFTQPETLDARLAALGWERFDETQVMTLKTEHLPAPRTDKPQLRAIDATAFAALIGGWRGSPPEHQSAHAERLAHSPVPFATFALEAQGQAVACGACAVEGEVVGLYDVFTAPSARRRGFADALCTLLLGQASLAGAREAYLQVEADNTAARALYRRLGFVDAYGYHYRALRAAAA